MESISHQIVRPHPWKALLLRRHHYIAHNPIFNKTKVVFMLYFVVCKCVLAKDNKNKFSIARVHFNNFRLHDHSYTIWEHARVQSNEIFVSVALLTCAKFINAARFKCDKPISFCFYFICEKGSYKIGKCWIHEPAFAIWPKGCLILRVFLRLVKAILSSRVTDAQK